MMNCRRLLEEVVLLFIMEVLQVLEALSASLLALINQ